MAHHVRDKTRIIDFSFFKF